MGAPAAPQTWTVLDLLRWTLRHFAERGIESPRLDAELLLAHALGCDRLRLYVEHDKPVGEAERTRFRELVAARARERVPVALLTGQREFWSLPLRVTRDVLVPRPETETLVEVALAAFPEREAELRVLDVGTGSGAVALALASERPKARVTATDVSAAALALARENAESLGLASRVRFLEGSLFEPVLPGTVAAAGEGEGGRFHLVVSNPPYLTRREAPSLAPELRHEPERALFAGEEGDELLRALVAGVAAVLEPGGLAAFELDPRQAEPIAQALAAAGLVSVAVHRDAARRPRVVSGRRQAA
jgi:release factor glutamine methyltransferase